MQVLFSETPYGEYKEGFSENGFLINVSELEL
jgi:hypothetical protein